MWWIIAALAAAGLLAVYGYRRAKSNNVPRDTFVCDICGEKHCLCRKEEKASPDHEYSSKERETVDADL